jgi:MarR family transcriptional regulator for hemolysin
MPDSSIRIYETILRLTRSVRAAFEQRVQQTRGLTYARARLLLMIGHNEGASQSELASLLGIETPTLKRQLDALEAEGLAERRPLAEDARKYAIHLTNADRIEPLLGFRAEVGAALAEGVSAEDLATTQRVLAQMAANAEKLKRS